MPIMKGSGKETGELLPVKCTYPECLHHFATQKEMKRHKTKDPEHDYCKKCNVDCDDWESFVQHKIDAMSPWLEGEMIPYARDYCNPDDDENELPVPKHIVCEFCGADFKTFGGRKAHRAQEHPADQSITCPGCGSYFIRAALLVQHLENGECSVITRNEFLGSIRQKHFLKEVFKAPDEYVAGLQMNKAASLGIEVIPRAPALNIDYLSMNDDDEGLSLLRDEVIATQGVDQMTGSDADLIDIDPPSTADDKHYGSYSRANDQKWPKLPGLQAVSGSRRPGSTAKGSSPEHVGSDSRDEASAHTGRTGGVKVDITSYPSRCYAAAVKSGHATNPRSSTVETRDMTNAGDNDRVSKRLTKENVKALPKAKAGDWSSFTKMKEKMMQDHKKDNLFYVHWWDPTSEDYNVDRFLAYIEVPKLDSRTGKIVVDPKTNSPIVESVVWKYCCPDPDCKFRFDNSAEFELHWLYGHGQLQWRCPCCLKLFKSVTSLIRHCESYTKCGVKHSDEFARVSRYPLLKTDSTLTPSQFLSDVTGGFLKSKRCKEPIIFRHNKALAVAGEPTINGMMPVQFTAKMPGDQ
nr:hypothetical protein CFP56_68635 [Quercus suber]